VILRFVDIGGIGGHQLFKRSFWLNVCISIFLFKTKTNNFIINVTVMILIFYFICIAAQGLALNFIDECNVCNGPSNDLYKLSGKRIM